MSKLKRKRVISVLLSAILVTGLLFMNDITKLNSFAAGEEEDTVMSSPMKDAKSRVSVHDPSIAVSNDGTYYVFGSHIAAAKSTDLMNWTSFTNGYATQNNTIFGDLSANLAGSFAWAGENDSDCLGGFAVWAPDVFWNPDYKNEDGTTGAYMIYYCTSSTYKRSAIGYAVSQNIEGPYTYVDTIIYSGFTKEDSYDNNSKINTNYMNTNIKTLIENKTLESANDSWFSSNGAYNTSYAPNAIDPTIFYDKDGKLWMTYGSWSGGIFLLEVDKETGKVTYPGTDGTTAGGNTIDRYFGVKIAGGFTKSGEGPYIMYDKEAGYYYLFMSYAGLQANGGYNMRMFRSTSVDGPYVDAKGSNAAWPEGSDNSQYGIKLMGNYNLDCLSVGYKAEGHNSAFIDSDGSRYLIYHTRFDNGSEGHEVRVHQMFLTEDGWYAVAPYEYNTEAISETGYSLDEITGEYQFINHGTTNGTTMLDTLSIKLNDDYTVSGNVTGTWSMKEGSYDMTFTYNDITYKGVFFKQNDESVFDSPVMTFSAIGSNNECIWGSRGISDENSVSHAMESLNVPDSTTMNLTLPTTGNYGTSIAWSSSDENVIGADGTVNRQVEDTTVTLKATITKNNVSDVKEFNVVVKGIGQIGVLDKTASYYYDFSSVENDNQILNKVSDTGNSILNGTAKIEEDENRGSVLHITNDDGAKKVNYLSLPTDTFDGITEGYTIGMWVNVGTEINQASQAGNDNWAHSALFEANGGGQDKYPLTRMGINLFSRINSNGSWSDATDISEPLAPNTWEYVTYTVSKTGINVYLNGKLVGVAENDLTNCFADNFMANANDVRVGSGNIWGDEDVADVKFDNVVVYKTPLTEAEAITLYNREQGTEREASKAQLSSDATSESEYVSIRFVSGVSSLDYSNAGFIVSLDEENPTLETENTKKTDSNIVYTSIMADNNKINARDVYGTKYLTTCKVVNIPNDKFDTTIYVRAYTVSKDGAEVLYGKTYTYTVNDFLNK